MDIETALDGCRASAELLLDMTPADAYAKIRTEENIDSSVQWCGFTLYNIMHSAGLDPAHRPLFPSTQGLLNFGSYYTRDIYGHEISRTKITKLVETGQDILSYHQERDSMRQIIWWETLQDESIELSILPGDIVLLDHAKGGGPDHIQIVRSWHPEERVLTVIDGNGGGFVLRSSLEAQYGTTDLKEDIHYRALSSVAESGKGMSTAEKMKVFELLEDLDVLLPVDTAGRVSVTCHTLKAANQINPTSDQSQNPHSRVFAIIRPSVADFESNLYTSI